MGSLTDFEPILRRAEPLAPRTWLRLGGPAELFAEPRSQDELVALVLTCQESGTPVRLLGGGSNLLVRDEGVKGVVVHLADPVFAKIAIEGDRVICGGAAKLGHVISSAVREGLAGLETLVGIPGTVGGALHGNAGGRGGDIGQWTARATVLNRKGQIATRHRDELVFGYRQSNLDELVILEAELLLERDSPAALTQRMQQQWIIKKAGQPLAHQSAGCIFKNPRGMSAGMLIDQAGLKGTRIGGAEVSDRHANFIVTESGATAADVLKLIELVRDRVEEKLGVALETEIEIW